MSVLVVQQHSKDSTALSGVSPLDQPLHLQQWAVALELVPAAVHSQSVEVVEQVETHLQVLLAYSVKASLLVLVKVRSAMLTAQAVAVEQAQ
jgi:hypothetical protein